MASITYVDVIKENTAVMASKIRLITGPSFVKPYTYLKMEKIKINEEISYVNGPVAKSRLITVAEAAKGLIGLKRGSGPLGFSRLALS